MHRTSRAEQDGADGHAFAAGHLDQVVGDVGGIDVRHDQQVGLTLERRVRVGFASNVFVQRRIAMHFAVNFQLSRRHGRNQTGCGTHLA